MTSDVQMEIEERLIQIVGHFFKYDTISGKNIPVKQGLFLCIDKVKKADDRREYMIHVVDQTGQLSYCRTSLVSESMIQFSRQD